MDATQRLDLGIALRDGSFDISYTGDSIRRKTEIGETTLLYFFFNLLRRLQQLGTVSAIDYTEYLKIIDTLN